MPADTAVALGAFLSHRGVTSPWLVFLVTITANTASATAIYFGARRLGPRFAASRWGARLLPRRTLLIVEGRYLRWGVPAIFLSRMIPGVRAIVPPFTGLIGLSPARALLPIVAASAFWYGFVTIAGVTLGAEWPRMVELLRNMNRWFAVAGILAAALLAVGILVRRRREKA